MEYEITIKPDDGTPAGWILQYFESNPPPVGDVNYQPVPLTDEGDGTFSATLDLDQREYGFACDLAFAGKSVEIDMTPRPKIFQPFDAEWPFTARVPDLMTMELVKVFFNTGEEQ